MTTAKAHITTTFQLSHALHTQMKMMCILTNKSMGEFIRICISEKVFTLQSKGK